MLFNFVALSIVVIVFKAITKAESESIREYFLRNRTEMKENLLVMIFFWKKITENVFWTSCLVEILIWQGSIPRMFGALAVLIIMSYIIAKDGCADLIDWSNDTTRRLISTVLATFAIIWLVNYITLSDLLITMIEIFGIFVGISVYKRVFGNKEER